MLLQRNLSVYQSGQPVWQIKNHPEVCGWWGGLCVPAAEC